MADASDEKQVSRAKQKAADRRRNHLRVLERLLADAPGRQFLWDMIEKGHVWAQTVDYQSHPRMCFKEGERTMALQLFNDIVQNYPQAYLLMTKENAAAADKLEEQDDGPSDTPDAG